MSDTNFTWNDELVLEFARFTNSTSSLLQGRYSDLEQFKESKQPKKKDWEKNWEIISYQFNPLSNETSKVVITKESEHWKNAVNDDNYSILTVRRISDSELFTIGDKLIIKSKSSTVWQRNPFFTIVAFNLNIEDKAELSIKAVSDTPVSGPADAIGDAFKTGFFFINEIFHAPKPLCVTTDGVEKFPADRCFVLDTIKYEISEWTNMVASEGVTRFFNKCLFYHTKEAAEMWIFNNKPLYSRTDLKITVDEFQRLLDTKTPE